jgi:hypothetical protein
MKKLKTLKKYAGQQGRCPLCGQMIRVPVRLSEEDTAEVQVLPLIPEELIEPSSEDSGVALGKASSAGHVHS